MKRAFDVGLALCLSALGLVPMLAIALAVKLTSKGPVLYWSERVGRGNRMFWMPKFRTMRTDTPQVASHLLTHPDAWLTLVGGLLRRLSLDELPQLWSIWKGDMTFVGPRPALYNQHDLVALRTEMGVHELVPGLTGWAQINGRDELPVPIKVELDAFYLDHQSLWLDLKIVLLTLWKVLRREGTVVPEDILGAHSSPSMAESLLDSGNAWYTKGEYKRAMADYDQAVRLDPANPMLYNCRGRAWSAQGEYTKALADFDEAIRREPTLAVAFHHRGNAWENTGEYERAREDHATAGRLDPQYAVLHLAQEMLPSVTTDVAKPVAGTASYTAGG